MLKRDRGCRRLVITQGSAISLALMGCQLSRRQERQWPAVRNSDFFLKERSLSLLQFQEPSLQGFLVLVKRLVETHLGWILSTLTQCEVKPSKPMKVSVAI